MTIRKITTDELPLFWERLYPYFDKDLKLDAEDLAYFYGEEYRNQIEMLFSKENDKLNVYFLEDNGVYRGFAMCVTYDREDGKCFLMEFCVDRAYRGNGIGAAFYSMLEQAETEARYVELTADVAAGFWLKQGFSEEGVNEWGQRLFRKRLE